MSDPSVLSCLSRPSKISVPVAYTVFPNELVRVPRSWMEKVYPNLIYFNEVDRGGHFAAWEEPQLFSRGVARRIRVAAVMRG